MTPPAEMRDIDPAAARKPETSWARRGMTLAAAMACASLAGVAEAAPMLETFGATGGVTPFSARVLPTGASATYFNPALLVDTGPGIQVGVFAVREALQIELAPRPAGIDVTDAIYDARAVNPDGSTRRLDMRPLPTSALRQARGGEDPSSTRAYLTVGTAVQIVPERLALGLHVLLPTRTFQTQNAAFADEREQYFSNSLHYELYGDRFETNLISLAAAARPFDGLTLGLGATASTEGRASNQAFVPDASDQDVTAVNTSVEVRTRFRPYMGVDVRPWGALHVVGTVHLPYANDTVGSNDLQLWNYEYPAGQSSFLQDFSYVSHATPLRAAVGAGWRPQDTGPVGWSAAGTLVWTRWSQFRDRHDERPLERWLDTFSVAAGGTFRWKDHRFGLDSTYVPSPVPDQVGRTNYVDSHRVGGALGYSARWTVYGARFEAGAQLQVHRLLPRSVVKSLAASSPVLDEFPDSVDARTGEAIPDSAGLQTNNPGYPGFSSQGWLMGGGVTLTALL